MGLFNFFVQDIAIDLGTANTIIYYQDKVVVDQPSIVAKDIKTGRVVAIGRLAQQMHGKTHKNIETIRPLRDGVIADFESAEQMIKGMIRMINENNKSWFTPSHRMVICIPSGITDVEKRAVKDSAEHAGGKDVYLIHEPMAAAIGIGIDVEEPMGNMIVDIGGGTTEIAVIALSGIVCDKSIKIEATISSLSAKISEAKMNKGQTLKEKRLNHLLSRMIQFSGEINNNVIQHTKKVIAFENKRKQFLLSRYKRFFQIIELFIKKQYSLYADGWRSAVKDMLAK